MYLYEILAKTNPLLIFTFVHTHSLNLNVIVKNKTQVTIEGESKSVTGERYISRELNNK